MCDQQNHLTNKLISHYPRQHKEYLSIRDLLSEPFIAKPSKISIQVPFCAKIQIEQLLQTKIIILSVPIAHTIPYLAFNTSSDIWLYNVTYRQVFYFSILYSPTYGLLFRDQIRIVLIPLLIIQDQIPNRSYRCLSVGFKIRYQIVLNLSVLNQNIC